MEILLLIIQCLHMCTYTAVTDFKTRSLSADQKVNLNFLTTTLYTYYKIQ